MRTVFLFPSFPLFFIFEKSELYYSTTAEKDKEGRKYILGKVAAAKRLPLGGPSLRNLSERPINRKDTVLLSRDSSQDTFFFCDEVHFSGASATAAALVERSLQTLFLSIPLLRPPPVFFLS